MTASKTRKKRRNPLLDEWDLVPNSSGIILDSMWVKKDGSELKIKSAFGGEWTFRPVPVDNPSHDAPSRPQEGVVQSEHDKDN